MLEVLLPQQPRSIQQIHHPEDTCLTAQSLFPRLLAGLPTILTRCFMWWHGASHILDLHSEIFCGVLIYNHFILEDELETGSPMPVNSTAVFQTFSGHGDCSWVNGGWRVSNWDALSPHKCLASLDCLRHHLFFPGPTHIAKDWEYLHPSHPPKFLKMVRSHWERQHPSSAQR